MKHKTISSAAQEPDNKFTDNLPEIIRQLEACKYTCQAGPLKNNMAFIELKRMAGLLPDKRPPPPPPDVEQT